MQPKLSVQLYTSLSLVAASILFPRLSSAQPLASLKLGGCILYPAPHMQKNRNVPSSKEDSLDRKFRLQNGSGIRRSGAVPPIEKPPTTCEDFG